jgi:hypothetical protein
LAARLIAMEMWAIVAWLASVSGDELDETIRHELIARVKFGLVALNVIQLFIGDPGLDRRRTGAVATVPARRICLVLPVRQVILKPVSSSQADRLLYRSAQFIQFIKHIIKEKTQCTQQSQIL